MPNTGIIVIIAGLAATLAWTLKPNQAAPTPSLSLAQIQNIGELASLKVNFAEVIEFNQKITQDIPWTQWELRFGATKILFVARGDCLIGTSLQNAKYEIGPKADGSAKLTIPAPRVISARLNHDPKAGGSTFYTVDSTGISRLIPGNDNQMKAVGRALANGQSSLEASCRKPEYLLQARKSAEAVLLPILSASGLKVTVLWQ
jgi:hypothetical protein